MIAYIKTPSALIINIDNEQFTVRTSDKKYKNLFEVVRKISNMSPLEETFTNELQGLKSLLAPIKRFIFNSEFQIDADDNGNLYLAGIEEMLPSELSAYIKEALENKENIANLIQFFRKLVQNPDARVRKQLFSFLQHNGHPITKNGFFITYKYVDVKTAYIEKEIKVETEVVDESVEEKPVEIKTVNDATGDNKFAGYSEVIMETVEAARRRKQSRKRYFAAINKTENHLIFIFADAKKGHDFECKEGYLFLAEDGTTLTLDDLYNDLMGTTSSVDQAEALAAGKKKEEKVEPIKPKMKTVIEIIKQKVKSTVFTDSHTRTMDIVLGIPVKQNRADCNSDPDVSCSRGLHVGSMAYVKGNRNMILSCLVSPANVVSVPRDYNNTKMRCCEYFPFAVTHEEYQEKFSDHDYENYQEVSKVVTQASSQSIL